jgi:shikimate kinase
VVKSTSENAQQNSEGTHAGLLKKRSGKSAGAKSRPGVHRNTGQRKAHAVHAIFLVGFMGAGKTSVGRALVQRLNWLFEDLDDRIQQREGRTIAEIFRDSGEIAFRRAEHEALQELLRRNSGARMDGQVIALGGGAFIQANNAALLSTDGVSTVFLDAPVDELWQRCCQQARQAGGERPLLGSPEQFRRLYDERRKKYAKAGMTVQTSNRSIDEIAAEIVQRLGLNKIPIRIEQGEVE